MYDTGKILTGIVIFAGLVSLPFWYNTGKAAAKPDPSLDTPVIQQMQHKHCIESKQYMIDNHMLMLNTWRNEFVREDKTIYTSRSGQKYVISLEDTCFHCHSNEKQFCNKCHTYVNVTPYCWECHIKPKEEVAGGQR